jgi:hypothetical protein
VARSVRLGFGQLSGTEPRQQVVGLRLLEDFDPVGSDRIGGRHEVMTARDRPGGDGHVGGRVEIAARSAAAT